MNQHYNYSYPQLSDHDFGFFRIGGPGLANCLFFATQAYIDAKINGTEYINPTWFKFSIGPWIRHEKDKRIYHKLFKSIGINGLKKALLISKFNPYRKHIRKFDSLNEYFSSINSNYETVMEMINKMILPDTVFNVNEPELKNKVAIHVRLGDYLPHLRVDINWYNELIQNISKIDPTIEFVLFSDGTDEELSLLLKNHNVRRCFFGNAFADMWAISKCQLLIASDSTFSAWGAFMGKVPLIFSKRHFPPVFKEDVPEFVLGDDTEIPDEIIQIIKSKN